MLEADVGCMAIEIELFCQQPVVFFLVTDSS